MTADKIYTASEIAIILGISKRAVNKRASKETWSSVENGKTKKYALAALPADIQEAVVHKEGASPDLLPVLSPSAAAKVIDQYRAEAALPTFAEAISPVASPRTSWTPETAVSEADLQNPRIRNILAILRDVDAMPKSWAKGKRKWVEAVALKHDVRWQSIYRWTAKYEKLGIAGLRHTKSYKDQPKTWTPEAVDWWISLCAKREHRGANRKDLYDILVIEAQRRGWQIGEYESANWWFKKKWNPLLEAMQKGGVRALDNLLPPVIRDYSDLAPFEILVGDQHRFDRWVVDDETGEVYRPEGYLWQDLRTRIIYGAAVDKKYDAWLIGLALRIGIACYGAFTSIYTDNGRPELSKYLTGILANLRALGMEWERTEEVVMDLLDVDGEDIAPHYIVPGTHRKAVVKNAKAKMIEGTFYRLEQIMTSRMLLPGQTKRMSDDTNWQDVDHQEAMKLAAEGRLLTGREFALAMYLACDIYNRKKAHRGVLREWSWTPRPKEATPYDCLMAVYNNDNWRPRMISAEAADLIFLARGSRIVNKGRISFENDFYEHDALLTLHKERVDIRYNPMTLDELHVFQGGRYLCTAVPVERSSMKDQDLASRKIAEKRERRKRFADEFRKIAALAPDFREYSKVPEAERIAALVGDDRKRRAIENKEFNRPITQEELDAHIEKMEAGLPLPAKARRQAPVRPAYFLDDYSRFEWIMSSLKAGDVLNEDDETFRTAYMAGMDAMQRDYYEFELAEGGN
jgi:putative transposase